MKVWRSGGLRCRSGFWIKCRGAGGSVDGSGAEVVTDVKEGVRANWLSEWIVCMFKVCAT